VGRVSHIDTSPHRREGKLEKAEGSGYGGLLDITEMHGNLVIGSQQVDFRIESATR
jgi:hypothetical protein